MEGEERRYVDMDVWDNLHKNMRSATCDEAVYCHGRDRPLASSFRSFTIAMIIHQVYKSAPGKDTDGLFFTFAITALALSSIYVLVLCAKTKGHTLKRTTTIWQIENSTEDMLSARV